MKPIQYIVDVLTRPRSFFDRVSKESVKESMAFIIPVVFAIHTFSFVFYYLPLTSAGKAHGLGDIAVFELLLLLSFVWRVLSTSFFIHLGFKLVGSKKNFSETFKVVAYVFTFMNLFSLPFVLAASPDYLMDFTDPLKVLSRIFGILVVGLWGLVIGLYGIYRIHQMSVLRTFMGCLAVIIVGIPIAFILGLLFYLLKWLVTG